MKREPNPKQGAILVRCAFCGGQNRPLEWVDGHGWCCPICRTNTEGKAPEDDTEAAA